MQKQLFLDSNAHIPMSSEVFKTYKYFSSTIAGYGHPLSPNNPGKKAALFLESARENIAKLLGAKSANNIIFTSSCTQACQWAVEILARQSNKIKYSPIEHSAVRIPIQNLSSNKDISTLNVSPCGLIIPEKADAVACIFVQNELGTIQPLEQLETNLLFSDMCQAVGKIHFSMVDMNVDISTFGAHKWGGPTGVGILYLKNIDLWQEFGTGSRYGLDRTGTPDVAAIIAAEKALQLELDSMDENLEKMREFQKLLEYELINNGIKVLCSSSPRVPNTTFIKCPNAFNVLNDLGNLGIHVGLGSACGGLVGSSPVVEAIGECGEITDFLRISTHGEYGKNEASYVAENIIKLAKLNQTIT